MIEGFLGSILVVLVAIHLKQWRTGEQLEAISSLIRDQLRDGQNEEQIRLGAIAKLLVQLRDGKNKDDA
jgi:hypothetical protein